VAEIADYNSEAGLQGSGRDRQILESDGYALGGPFPFDRLCGSMVTREALDAAIEVCRHDVGGTKLGNYSIGLRPADAGI
jgi:hypothetical protein